MKKKKKRQSLLDAFIKYMDPPEEDDYDEYYDEEEDEETGVDAAPKEASGPKLYREPGRRGNLRLVKNGDAEPESGKDWEEDEDDEDDEAERPWVTVMTFLGIAVLAAIICAILWYFTHPEKPGSGQSTTPGVSGAQEPGGSSPGQITGAESGGAGEGGPGESSGIPDGTDGGAGENPEDGGDGAGQTAGDAGAGSGQAAPGSPGGEEAGVDGGPEQGEEGYDSEQTPGGEGDISAGEGTGAEFQITEGQGTEADREPASGTASMRFEELKESVTPKDVVNLRSVPTTADESNIIVQCKNGEILTRIGINQDTGWSQVVYGDQTLYAVSQYLTTNLDYTPPVQASNPNRVGTASGRVVIFSNCDDWISPKEYVNLRTEPSTDAGNDTVSCQLNYGEKAHRTGYSADSGWSRVEYDGKVLYVVNSLMYEVDPD